MDSHFVHELKFFRSVTEYADKCFRNISADVKLKPFSDHLTAAFIRNADKKLICFNSQRKIDDFFILSQGSKGNRIVIPVHLHARLRSQYFKLSGKIRFPAVLHLNLYL